MIVCSRAIYLQARWIKMKNNSSVLSSTLSATKSWDNLADLIWNIRRIASFGRSHLRYDNAGGGMGCCSAISWPGIGRVITCKSWYPTSPCHHWLKYFRQVCYALERWSAQRLDCGTRQWSTSLSMKGSPGISSSYWELVTTWVSMRSLHLWLRYQTLAVLRFDTVRIR